MDRSSETKSRQDGRPVLIPAVAAALSCKRDPKAETARRRERLLAELRGVFSRNLADAKGVIAGFGSRPSRTE